MKKNDALAKEEAKEVPQAGRVKGMHIDTMDDGTYHLTSTTDKGHAQHTTHPSADHLMSRVKDNLESPHLPQLGTGVRFASLEDKLSRQPGVRNPAGLAASIARKKYGTKKFDALA